uniref:Uncharacterized protein n=1 Tax=Aegilops tauschii TaxID=37682 RepID=M8CE03_AEGTA
MASHFPSLAGLLAPRPLLLYAATIGLPLDGPPGDPLCVPAGLFGRTVPDVVVPLVFAVVVVAGATAFTAAVGVWEDDEDDIEITEVGQV